MKFMKLFSSATAACLLASASSAAMARNDCPEGNISGGTFDDIVITEFVDCSIVGVIVTGRVLVKGADQFTMLSSKVDGNLRVVNTVSAALVGNLVENGGNLVAKGNVFSTVLKNSVVGGGSILVNDDACAQQQEVLVAGNLVFDGNLRVDCNNKASVRENSVTNGDLTCRDNDRLDSIDNDAFGGRVKCSRNLFN